MKNILAADIGGTNSRFAHFRFYDDYTIEHIDGLRLETNAAATFDDLMHQMFASGIISPDIHWDAVVLAVPGAVRENTYATLANVRWSVDISNLRARLPASRIFLVNDFVAQAFACLLAHQLETSVIQKGVEQEGANIAVVGAGTGLGHCALAKTANGFYLPLPSEAGHTSFAFQGNIETGYGEYIVEKTGMKYPYSDLVVSGLGLVLLHTYLTGRELTPSQVVKEIGPESETTVLFSRFYARACRNYALAILAFGGLFVTGGVAIKNPFLVMNDHFRNEFADSPHFGRALKDIPVTLILDEDSGLWGAANYGVLNLRNVK
ncbi:MAG: glucokinase [Syntrophorhabdus sp.]